MSLNLFFLAVPVSLYTHTYIYIYTFIFGKRFGVNFSSMCDQVSQYLRSRNWDTRVAAAHAVGAIAENVKHTSVNELFACIQSKMCDAGISAAVEDMVALPMFDSNIAGTSFRR